MNALTSNHLLFLLIFFLPGFVSLKIYDLLVPNENRDFSKQFLDAIVYSLINFLLLFWMYTHFLKLLVSASLTAWMYAIIICFVGPIMWPIIFLMLTQMRLLRKLIISPIKRPWDWFFSKKEPLWVIIELMDGKKIGGILADNSYVSSHPAEEQIYLEEVWRLDEQGHFYENGKIENSKDVIILGKNISSLEFFKNED